MALYDMRDSHVTSCGTGHIFPSNFNLVHAIERYGNLFFSSQNIMHLGSGVLIYKMFAPVVDIIHVIMHKNVKIDIP